MRTRATYGPRSAGGDSVYPRYSGDFIVASVRRLWCVDALPLAGAFMVGPRWRRVFDVEERPLEEVDPPWRIIAHARRRRVLCFTLEEDVRELVTA